MSKFVIIGLVLASLLIESVFFWPVSVVVGLVGSYTWPEKQRWWLVFGLGVARDLMLGRWVGISAVVLLTAVWLREFTSQTFDFQRGGMAGAWISLVVGVLWLIGKSNFSLIWIGISFGVMFTVRVLGEKGGKI